MSAPTSELTLNAATLMGMTFPEPHWAVPGIQPAGLTLLVGRPKRGKSWYALQIALAVACGGRALGRVRVEPGAVLVLALEDTFARLQGRLSSLLQGTAPPAALEFRVVVPREGEGGLEWIQGWLTSHPGARLVVVDTLARFRRPQGRGNAYEDDYRCLVGLKRLADAHGVSILVVHHTRKMVAADPIDLISGTAGLAGAADCVQILKRERDQAEAGLFVTGRDVEERTLTIRWDAELTSWTLTEPGMTAERFRVVETLETHAAGLTPAEMAPLIGKTPAAARLLLWRMAQAGQIRKRGSTYISPPLRNRGTPETVGIGKQ